MRKLEPQVLPWYDNAYNVRKASAMLEVWVPKGTAMLAAEHVCGLILSDWVKTKVFGLCIIAVKKI